MDLWPIGNCQVSALVDAGGRFVWGCVPRVDGDPAFSALLAGEEAETGFWAIELDGCTRTTQHYLRNTPILVTRHEDAAGNAVEITDFCPRFMRDGRAYRPTAFVRIVRPVAGSPRIRVVLRVSTDWGRATSITMGSNHIRYLMSEQTLRLTTNAPIDHLRLEDHFRVEKPLHFFLGPDESFGVEELMQVFGRLRLDVENCARELVDFGVAEQIPGDPPRYMSRRSPQLADVLDHFMEVRATVSSEDQSPSVQRFREMKIGRAHV